jgi:hypothetical protein
VGVDAQHAAPPPRQCDHRLDVGVVDLLLGLAPDVTQRAEPFAAEHGGHRRPHAADVFARKDTAVDPGQQQSGELAGVPRVVNAGVVDADQLGDGVPQPLPVPAAAVALPVLGAGLFQQPRDVGHDRRRVPGYARGPAAVDRVAGFVDQQPVRGRYRLLVAGPVRVGHAGSADMCGVDLDAPVQVVEAGRRAAAGAGGDHDGQVAAAGQGRDVVGPGVAPRLPGGVAGVRRVSGVQVDSGMRHR